MWMTRPLPRTWRVRHDGVILGRGLLAQVPLVRHDPAGNRLTLPPVMTVMDPSDPRTWRRPVRFT